MSNLFVAQVRKTWQVIVVYRESLAIHMLDVNTEFPTMSQSPIYKLCHITMSKVIACSMPVPNRLSLVSTSSRYSVFDIIQLDWESCSQILEKFYQGSKTGHALCAAMRQGLPEIFLDFV